MRLNLTEKQQHHKTPFKSRLRFELLAWVLLVMLTITLSGCGNKGDLYVPEKDEVNQQEMSQSNG